MLSAPLARRSTTAALRRTYQTIGMFVTLFVIVRTSHTTPWATSSLHIAFWNQWYQLLLEGVAVGILTQLMGLPSGILLVPTAYFFAGYAARQAVLLSLVTVALASILPAWSYGKRGLIDSRYVSVLAVGGVIGGALGGATLISTAVSDHGVLYLFAVIGMFLCAREIYRLSNSTN
jgi:uncharacterized membrane protein YfcA